MKLKKWEIAMLLAVTVSLLISLCLTGEQDRLSGKLIRLHIVADADTPEAQAAKLRARDAVLKELSAELEGVTDRRAAERLIEAELSSLTAAAVSASGYSASSSLRREYFPTRNYTDFSLPAGEYTSLRIVLGSGEGRNWWCVVFPPICSGALEESAAAASLTEGELSLITEENTGYVIKFKALELLGEIKRRLFG